MDILDGFPGYGSTPNNLGPGGKAPQATLYLITLPSTGIIWSTTPSTLILSSSFHPGARLSKPNLLQTSQGQWSTRVTSWKPGFCWALVIRFLHSLHCSDEAGPPKTLNVTVVKDEWHNDSYNFFKWANCPIWIGCFHFHFHFCLLWAAHAFPKIESAKTTRRRRGAPKPVWRLLSSASASLTNKSRTTTARSKSCCDVTKVK